MMTTALAPPRDALPEACAPVRFGDFPITETRAFPPPAGAACWVYLTLNAEIALSLPGNPALRRLIASPRARVSVDGQWVWWALRRKYGERAPSKLSGSDLIHVLAAHAARTGERLLLLGTTPHANAAAVQALRRRAPGLEVAGYAPPHCPGEASAGATLVADAWQAIEAYRPQHVVLGLGAAKEQRLAEALMPRLDGIVHGLYCFGGAIDFAGGSVRRAPRWMQCSGLEGLYRVLQQPSRFSRALRILRLLPLLATGRY